MAPNRHPFLDSLGRAYNDRRKNVALLTGGVRDVFWDDSLEAFVPLEQRLYQELKSSFDFVRMDAATGINFYDEETEREVYRVCESTDGMYVSEARASKLRSLIESSRSSPLPTLVLLKGMADAYLRLRRVEPKVRPLCVLIQHAGSLFPEGEYSRLSELDRQRLVFFLSWITDPVFHGSVGMILLVSDTRSEVNAKILSLPCTEQIEIQLPDADQRRLFLEQFQKHEPGLAIEGGDDQFVEDTAGMNLTGMEDLLGAAARSDRELTRSEIFDEVNTILQGQLGDIIRIKHPAHTTKDIIGYAETGNIFRSIFERCEDPETAVSAVLVSGPNGGGKTFQLEAYASESGRIVVELASIRGSYFGETDRFFELLRWHITTYGKILILVDEAHTAFGSVHSKDVHQTEMRLAGNIIKMMGDPRYLGKVVWALMTSRPDELDPDIKSRSPMQVPIFDLEGAQRAEFVAAMFRRKDIGITKAELDEVLAQTHYYSARDFRNLVAEVLAHRRKEPEVTVLSVLQNWQASKSIEQQREFQSLIAALHCSYPQLLPSRFLALGDTEILKRVEVLKRTLDMI